MICAASNLDTGKLGAIKTLEQEIGKTIVAYSCSDPKPSNLTEEEIRKIKALEEKLAVTLVAFN
ncbi:hypothetical protein [Desulfoluna sp.]|uniref:hypothetical protein n=1 Tax=Desulfoluna sp. TaxID=2045199 RepID=UPI00261F68CC|nr:hypothetical protein [Desulfoluna sp.]